MSRWPGHTRVSWVRSLVALAIAASSPAQQPVSIAKIPFKKGPPLRVYFSTDGKELISISARGEFEFRSLATGEVVRRFTRNRRALPKPLIVKTGPLSVEDREQVLAAVPLPDGPRFASINSNHGIELWADPVRTILWSSDSRRVLGHSPSRSRIVVSESKDSSLLAGSWSVDDRSPFGFERQVTPSTVPEWGDSIHLTALRPLRLLAVSNDGAAIAACGVQLWRCDRGRDGRYAPKPVVADAGAISQIGFLAENRLVYLDRGKLVGCGPRPIPAERFAISCSGNVLAVSDRGALRVLRPDGSVQHTFERKHREPLSWLAVNDDGRHVAGVSARAVHLYGPAGRTLPYWFASEGSMAFTGDNRFLVIPRVDDFVTVHPETGIPRRIGADFDLGRCLVAPLGDGAKVLARCRHGFFAVDAARGRVLLGFSNVASFPLDRTDRILASPDERFALVAAGKYVAVRELATGRRALQTLPGPIVMARWTADSRHVLLRVGGARTVAHLRLALDGTTERIDAAAFPAGSATLRQGFLMRKGQDGLLQTQRLGTDPVCEAVSEDGTRAAVLCEQRDGAELRIFDLSKR